MRLNINRLAPKIMPNLIATKFAKKIAPQMDKQINPLEFAKCAAGGAPMAGGALAGGGIGQLLKALIAKILQKKTEGAGEARAAGGADAAEQTESKPKSRRARRRARRKARRKKIGGFFKKVGGAIKKGVNKVIGGVAKVAGGIAGAVLGPKAGEFVKKATSTVLNIGKSIIASPFKGAANVVKGIKEGDWKKALGGAFDVATAVIPAGAALKGVKAGVTVAKTAKAAKTGATAVKVANRADDIGDAARAAKSVKTAQQTSKAQKAWEKFEKFDERVGNIQDSIDTYNMIAGPDNGVYGGDAAILGAVGAGAYHKSKKRRNSKPGDSPAPFSQALGPKPGQKQDSVPFSQALGPKPGQKQGSAPFSQALGPKPVQQQAVVPQNEIANGNSGGSSILDSILQLLMMQQLMGLPNPTQSTGSDSSWTFGSGSDTNENNNGYGF